MVMVPRQLLAESVPGTDWGTTRAMKLAAVLGVRWPREDLLGDNSVHVCGRPVRGHRGTQRVHITMEYGPVEVFTVPGLSSSMLIWQLIFVVPSPAWAVTLNPVKLPSN